MAWSDKRKLPMTKTTFENTLQFAKSMDRKDPLKKFRKEFHFPKIKGKDSLYFCGNSLGLQPKKAKEYVNQELMDWAKLGVTGHFKAKNPWLPYHEFLTCSTAGIAGAMESEVVVMNTLSVNLHLMMVSFYRPTSTRYKILIESMAFPSDHYAVASQAQFHGYDPRAAVLKLTPRPGEQLLRTEDILSTIEKEGQQIALILLGNVNYLTGQAFDMKLIAEAGHKQGCKVGFDLAHGAGNLKLNLHDDGVDFATWCSYKYLNSGPGSLSGCFVHERHLNNRSLPRFAGWWGHDKVKRFEMKPDFDPMPTAEAWQLSNPPIFQLAALRASMELFDQAKMERLRNKSEMLTGYLNFIINQIGSSSISMITPTDPAQRGCQLSLQVKNGKQLEEKLLKAGVICDFRAPDIIRFSPVPLYNSFEDVFKLGALLKKYV
jgi:kynureninase